MSETIEPIEALLDRARAADAPLSARQAAFPGWLRLIVRTCCRRLRREHQPSMAPLEASQLEVRHGDDDELRKRALCSQEFAPPAGN